MDRCVIAHIFDQEAFCVPLETIEKFDEELASHPQDAVMIQMTKGIFKKVQVYDRVDAQGAAEKKVVFIVSPAISTKIGVVSNVTVEAQLGLSASKKYVCHPVFSGGELEISDDFRRMLVRSGV